MTSKGNFADLEAIKAAQYLIDYCEDWIVCKDCPFCMNKDTDALAMVECALNVGTFPSFWKIPQKK